MENENVSQNRVLLKTAMRVGNWASLARASRRSKVTMAPRTFSRLMSRVNNISRTIETKENQWRTQVNVSYPHNNLTVILDTNGNPLNPFWMGNGVLDNGSGFTANANRIGDQISVKGIMFKGFFENSLSRPNVHYKLMLVRSAKGDTITRATFYKGNANNKMIDQMDNERYTVVASKTFNIKASNPIASIVDAVGQPQDIVIGGDYNAGSATRVVSMWIPGRKFGKGGIVRYENTSGTQLKFYDYRFVLLCYDWYGTPQDVNNVGRINEAYCKIYFKDA